MRHQNESAIRTRAIRTSRDGNSKSASLNKRTTTNQKRASPEFPPATPIKSAITYCPAEQYHWRQRLNVCVRDGNRCDPLSIVTDKSEDALPGVLGKHALSRVIPNLVVQNAGLYIVLE